MQIAPTTLAALSLALITTAGSAVAAPVVNWEYTVSSAFNTSAGATTFTGGGGCQQVTASGISWGACPPGPPGSGRSGIGISNSPQGGLLTTNGAAQPANTYTHSNNVVSSAFATLTGATINAMLGLRVQGSGDPFTYASASYAIKFAETPNQAGTCAASSPPNNPCNDIWVLDGSLNHILNFDGNQYFFSFFASPALATLPDNVCAAAGALDDCIGFTTIEGQENAVNFLLKVTSRPLVVDVPEPGSIALLGIGLLGLAGLRRRGQKPA